MKRWRGNRLLVALLGLLLAQWVIGCATNDEGLSEQPWNTPRSWETGLPSSMTEERR